MLKLTWPMVTAWRLRRQRLEERAPTDGMLAVASRLCRLHAQLISTAELTLWTRVQGLARRDVERALWEDRTLVKTCALRGTLHLLCAQELPLWHAGLGISLHFLKPARWQKYFGITLDELNRLTDAIARALEGGVLTREELAREAGSLARRNSASTWQRAVGARCCGQPRSPADCV
jgi:hypothetical protein